MLIERVRTYSVITKTSLLLALASLAGCGMMTTFNASQSSHDDGNATTAYEPTQDRYLIETAQRFGLMALLAEAVYRRDLPNEVRDEQGCAYVPAAASGREPPAYGLPESESGRWLRWTPQAKPGVVPCLSHESGLHYETYVFEHGAKGSGHYSEAVIAFRGTENRSGQLYQDWRSNLAAMFGREPEQYAVAHQHMLPLINELAATLMPLPDGPRIYVTGHSLGGGLAQQTGYLSTHVKEVFTFNTSPVTNWSQLRLQGLVKQPYPSIHRVYNGGEILEKVRFITTMVTHARYGRHDIGLQLGPRKNIEGHSMQDMACKFAGWLKEVPGLKEADHGYSVDFIRNTLLNEQRSDQPCSKALGN